MFNLYLYKSHIFNFLETISQQRNYLLMEIFFLTVFYFPQHFCLFFIVISKLKYIL